MLLRDVFHYYRSWSEEGVLSSGLKISPSAGASNFEGSTPSAAFIILIGALCVGIRRLFSSWADPPLWLEGMTLPSEFGLEGQIM
jgi:hypothetical protein